MAVFNEAYYLKSKLAQLQSLEGGDYADWTTAMVRQAILDAGMTVDSSTAWTRAPAPTPISTPSNIWKPRSIS